MTARRYLPCPGRAFGYGAHLCAVDDHPVRAQSVAPNRRSALDFNKGRTLHRNHCGQVPLYPLGNGT